MSNLNRRDFTKFMGSLWATAMVPMSALSAALPSVATKTVTQPKVLDFNISRHMDFDFICKFPSPIGVYDDNHIRNHKIKVSMDYLSEDDGCVHRLEFERTLDEDSRFMSHKKLDNHVSQEIITAYDTLRNQVSLDRLTIGDCYDLDAVLTDDKNSSSLLLLKDMKLVKITLDPKEEEQEEEEEQEDDKYYYDYDYDYNAYSQYE